MKTHPEFTPIIQIDSREPDPHPWASHFTVPLVREAFPTGDFSLPGCAEMVAVERKTMGDLVSCLCAERDRFTKELQRAQAIPHFWVVCEGSYDELLSGQYQSNMGARAAFQSVVAMMTRFKVPFLMAGSPRAAAVLTESLLLKWLTEHRKVLETCRKASRKISEQPRALPAGTSLDEYGRRSDLPPRIVTLKGPTIDLGNIPF